MASNVKPRRFVSGASTMLRCGSTAATAAPATVRDAVVAAAASYTPMKSLQKYPRRGLASLGCGNPLLLDKSNGQVVLDLFRRRDCCVALGTACWPGAKLTAWLDDEMHDSGGPKRRPHMLRTSSSQRLFEAIPLPMQR
jgi:hypothetical protein